MATGLLNHFYTERTITVTSRDPAYTTPSMKAKLRSKNRMMRSGRIEKANALAVQISEEITQRNKSRCQLSLKAVRQVTGTKYSVTVADGISAESLNDHYANISTDQDYSHPKLRSTCSVENQELFQTGLFSKCLTNFDPRQQVWTVFLPGL